jgi:hypothetical protein
LLYASKEQARAILSNPHAPCSRQSIFDRMVELAWDDTAESTSVGAAFQRIPFLELCAGS